MNIQQFNDSAKTTSLFAIESLLLPKQDNRWQDYLAFVENLRKDLNDSQRDSIIKYWHSYDEKHNPTSASMEWIDAIALANAKKNIENDKEKRNTKCFNGLVMKKTPLYPDDFSIFDKLDKELPNFKEVTAFYRGSFALNQSRDVSQFQAPKVVLLLGNPGIGKTHYAKKLASMLKTSYRFFDANSINGGWVLSGNNASWRGADAGLIFKEMAKSTTISPIILLDEIDKISSTKEHSPFSIMHQLFEKENANKFYDEFVDVEFDASQIIYILTANDVSKIPESLLSRMTVFNVKNPDEEAMIGIINNIYSSTLGGSTLFKNKLGKAEIDKLVKFTPREVSQIITSNLFNKASDGMIKQNSQKAKPLIIDVNPKKEKQPIGFK